MIRVFDFSKRISFKLVNNMSSETNDDKVNLIHVIYMISHVSATVLLLML